MAQTITTIAGNGTFTYSGDGGTALAAGVGTPGSAVFDKYGNLYVVQTHVGRCVRKITPSGIITTVAGVGGAPSYSGDGGPATAASFKEPVGLALDTFGNLFISDQVDHRIRKVNITTGIITTVVGTGVAGYNGDGILATSAQINTPAGLIVDSVGNLFIADAFNNRVRKVDASGNISTVVGTGGTSYSGDGSMATATSIYRPIKLCFHEGSLHFTDRRRVMKVNGSGIITTYAGDGTGSWSAGDGGPATDATMTASELVFDSFGNLYIGEWDPNNVVRRVNTSNIISTIAGIPGMSGGGYSGDGGPATSAQFHRIYALIFDTCGNLVISDIVNNRVRKIYMAQVSVTATPGDTVCVGTPVTYTAASTSGNVTAYKWYKNGIVSGTGSIYTYTPLGGDSVRCVLTISSCGFGTVDISSNTINMVVAAPTTPTISLWGMSFASVGSMVTVNATVAGAGSTYNIRWFRNSALFGTTSVPMVTYTKVAGTDTITARVVSTAVGCYDSIMSAAHLVFEAPAGVDDISAQAMVVSVYPNPAKDELHVYVEHGCSYIIMGIEGRDLCKGILHKGDNTISLQALPSGIYIAEVVTPAGAKVLRRVVKE